MNKPSDWIKCHPVIAFYIITFAITWGLGFSYGAVLKKGQFLWFPVVSLATCGPALAGIIVSAISDTQPRQGTRRTFWVAFLAAWVVSALVFLAGLTFLEHIPFSPVLIVFAFVAVAPVAFVVSAAYSSIPALRNYLSSLIRLRGVWGWSLVALTLMPGLILLSIPISRLFGRQSNAAYAFSERGLALVGLIAVKFLYQLFFFNATGEEAGWRGFALPRLQSRFSPLLASLIVGLFWVTWHFFLWQAEGNPVFSWQFWAIQGALHLPASVIIGWLYNRSRGSILVAGIAHAAANTAITFCPNRWWPVYASTLALGVLAVILADRMWVKLPPDDSGEHPAVYREPALNDRWSRAKESRGCTKWDCHAKQKMWSVVRLVDRTV